MIIRHISAILLMALMFTGCAKPRDGHDGASGPAGPAGVDTANVTAVKFCRNAVTVYPSSFPEYGFCISGRLYATYWDGHNAWSAEVVPGYYASTSTSAPCNFTVSTNCVVTP